MPKIASTALHDFVSSLTGTEKRYIKLKFKSLKNQDSVHLKLFDFIKDQESYNDAATYQHLKKAVGSYANFTVIKNQHFHHMLKMMRQYQASNPSVDDDLSNRITDARFLLKKGLHILGNKELVRAKELAYKYQRYQPILTIIDLQINYQQSLQKAGKAGQSADLLLKEAAAVSLMVDNLLRVFAIEAHYNDIILESNIPRTQKAIQVKQLYQYAHDACFSPEVLLKSVEARTLHLYIHQSYKERKAFLENKTPNWRALRKEYEYAIKEMTASGMIPVLESFPSRYVMFLFNYLRLANNSTLPDAQRALDFFKSANIKDERSRLTQVSMAFYMSLRFSLIQADKRGFSLALKEFTPFFKKHLNDINKSQLLGLYFCMGELHLMHHQYRQSERCLRQLLKASKANPGLRIDIIKSAYLLLAIVHAEMKNRTKTYQTVRAARGFYAVVKDVGAIEYRILDYCLEAIRAKNDAEREIMTSRLIEDLKPVRNTTHMQYLESFFNFYDWFESKLQGLSFKNRIRKANGLPIIKNLK